MATSQQNNEDKQEVSSELPVDINEWNQDHVRQWLLKIKVDKYDAEILYKAKVNGAGLFRLKTSDLTELGLSFNAKKLIINYRDELKQELLLKYGILKPYPFKRFDAAHRYKENAILDVNETGPVDLIQPCHEFKNLTNSKTEEEEMTKYRKEVIRFAAACMNRRTNGTIHFGVADNPHGQILGISVQKKEKYEEQQLVAIKKHFQPSDVEIAKRCIMTPRFVEVLKADMTSTGKFVIEVDIEPSFNVCKDSYFITLNIDTDRNNGMSFFIREGSSTTKLTDYLLYIADMPKLSQLRKDAEEKHLSVIKNSVEGSKLCEMLTGGTHSLDKSHFQHYILVANKSHPVQLDNLKFLTHMNLVAVLDFDPESGEKGLNKRFKDSKTNNHLPAEYQIIQTVEDTAEKLELTKNTSWVFCNGGCKEEKPSDVQKWSIQKGASVQDVVYLLCRKDVLPNKKFLIIFLLLSQVTDGQDPLLETFNKFLQGLQGTNQILCICDNKTTYTYWKDLIMGRYRENISTRCISELSFAEINGTVLSLWSENRKSERFLPGVGDSKVVLSRDIEKTLEMLSILCVNQCDGGNEDKQQIEERFYRGGKVSWWNFYFSEQPGSVSLIKRDKLDYIVNTIIPDLLTEKRTCVFFHISHLPQRGATTLAMHVLWTLKKKYRCAMLKDQKDKTDESYAKVAEQVVKLLTYKAKEQPDRLLVLLMIDLHFDEHDVKNLQQKIEEECLKQNISSMPPQVILMNCMIVESREQAEEKNITVFLGDSLSEEEQKYMDAMQKEFERTNTNTETFQGFMFLMTNFSHKYIEDVVENTMKGFNFQQKHAQLFAVLVLLDVYCRNASLSVSTCEKFLHLQTTENYQSCTIEDGFENLSSLLTRCTVSSKVIFEGVRVINSSIAQQCLEELNATYGVTKAEIINILLTADLFNDCLLGKHKLMSDVHSMLCDVKRQHSTKDEGLFSPLIHDIMKETPGLMEEILNNAAKFYRKDVVIFQLIARYYYKYKKDYRMAEEWEKKAKDHSKDNSDICDTVAQVLKSEQEYNLDQDRDDPIKPDSLEKPNLTLAESATKACKETQDNLIKNAEEKHLCVIKKCGEGPKLCEILTGGTHSLDKSHFQCYVLVANKSHPVQLENLKFLTYMNLVAVLDLDPKSAENGLNTLFKDRNINNHLPIEYQIIEAVEDTAEKLELTRKTSWVFCNGGYKEESPSDFQNWSVQKGASVRDVVSFLCRKDVLPYKKFLIIFLLLSQVNDEQDPMLETFNMFLQELKATNQILCICDNETTYTYWKDLIMGRYKDEISQRCISELSLAKINGTVLSLWSENRKSERFLPGVGDSRVVLSRDTEDTLDMLSILCVNQCDGGNEDKQQVEERFYRGGKVSWWNFYFSEQPGSVSLIKRDKLDYIANTFIPKKLNKKRTCVFFHILHLPQHGATTLAMQVLWTLKDKYRCAVLKDQTDESYTKVAEQVVKLLTYKTEKQPAGPSVLLMIDLNFKESDVKNLQQKIEEECLKQNIYSIPPQVILMNCMIYTSFIWTEKIENQIFLGDCLSLGEQKQVDAMQKDFDRTNTNTETLYGFMFLKTNFSSRYIQGVVKNTLKGFNFQQKHAQLFAVLVLLDVYCRNASLSVSTCEEFLHLQTTENYQSCTIEDGFENLSSLLTRCTVYSKIIFEGVRVINSSIAQQCLKELTATHGVTKAEITNILLTADLFNDGFLGKQKVKSDVHSMLVKTEHFPKGRSLFSPLIHDIMKETPGKEEEIFNNAAHFYRKDGVIFQLLARYYYINKKDFKAAMEWAIKARKHSNDHPDICDTVAQVNKSKLKYELDKVTYDLFKPDSLEMYLTLAESAKAACKETQETAHGHGSVTNTK